MKQLNEWQPRQYNQGLDSGTNKNLNEHLENKQIFKISIYIYILINKSLIIEQNLKVLLKFGNEISDRSNEK